LEDNSIQSEKAFIEWENSSHELQPLFMSFYYFKKDIKKAQELAKNILKVLQNQKPLVEGISFYYQYLFGRLYHLGLGVEKDLKMAFKYYIESSEGFCAISQNYVLDFVL